MALVGSGVDLLFKLAKIFNQAGTAARFTGDTGITAVQNQPVMAVHFEFRRNHL